MSTDAAAKSPAEPSMEQLAVSAIESMSDSMEWAASEEGLVEDHEVMATELEPDAQTFSSAIHVHDVDHAFARGRMIEELAEDPDGDHAPMPGFARAYHSYDNPVRGFDAAKCTHQGVDIGGVGPGYGIGTSIHAIVKSKIIFIGTPESNPSRFGVRRKYGRENRFGTLIPRTMTIPGYGTIHPFVKSVGSARTGVFLITKAVGTHIDGYYVRYMHMAAVHPDLQVGDIVEPGQEVGLMGATGTRNGMPHLHLDIEKPSGVRVDPAPMIGLGNRYPSHCRPVNKQARKLRKRKARRAAKLRKKNRSKRKKRS